MTGVVAAQLALADALYAGGELEWALVVYWRGLQARPGLEQLQNGTRRCEDHILRAIERGEECIQRHGTRRCEDHILRAIERGEDCLQRHGT